MKEMVGGCCVCSDDRGWPENPLVYCDGQSCTVAVHQACYGIVTVPTGPWYCRKCESQERSVKVKCELCPSKYGALKRTDTNAWAHVVCALYIPEVRFGNVTTMEPIQLQMIPAERFSKTCYICEEGGKASSASFGACMQCNKTGCKQQFHVTCAQGLGLLCEEAGNYLDNVKYCGYCQHHYSKLKKGGNVKTIPPYKPVSDNHNSDSNSEREAEQANITRSLSQTSSTSSSSSKRKSSSNSKNSSSSSSKNPSSKSSSSSSHQKSVHNSSKASGAEKTIVRDKSSSGSAKKNANEDITSVEVVDKSEKKEVKDTVEEAKEVKEGKGKKRKANSRTPTPVAVVSAVTENVSVASVASADVATIVAPVAEKKEVTVLIEPCDKPKKLKTDSSSHTPTIVQTPPLSAPSVTPTLNSSATPSPVIPETVAASPSPSIASVTTSSSIIQATATQLPINSLVVSVPLHNASLSPHPNIVNNQSLSSSANFLGIQERSSSVELTPPISSSNNIMTGGSGSQTGVITSDLGGGDLRIVYEKQVLPSNSTLQMELERVTPTPELPPTKRARSQSTDKNDKPARTKKRASAAATASTSYSNNHGSNSGTKRSSRSQSSLEMQSASFSSLSQNSIKESPPSSPSSESLGAAPTNGRRKGRKSAPASVCGSAGATKNESKDVKIFQNGIHAPHMLGNQLNPNSNMAQKMTDHLNSELEAHSIFNQSEASCALVGPPLQHRVIASVRSNSTGGSSTASGGSGLSSMLGGGSGVLPQTLEQLLERHWEQGSQFLMEQAQHFDIASLLTCLHQLRAENLRLEEHVTALVQRRDHLLAINARLALPLVGQAPHTNNHTVNNIHPHVSSTQNEPSRQRHSSYSSHSQNPPVENGIPPDQYANQHRSPVTAPQPQPSPQSVRHSPAGGSGYPSAGLLRQNVPETGSRSASRSQQYPMAAYQGPSPSSQQMMMRRDSDLHHQSSSKPS